jgi:2-dehydropantoate 2-reductase
VRIAVVGAGGVGGYYGALLRRSGQDVTFLARGRHLQAIQAGGLRIESTLGEPFVLPVRASGTPADVGPVDLALFTVKSYDSAAAAAALPPMLAPGAAVLTLQNGVENVEVLAAAVGRGRVLGGLCQIFCHIAAPGVIRHTGGPRRVVLGELDGEITPRAEAAHAAFAAAGVPVELSRVILVDMWEKYLFISAQGGMTALTRMPVGVIRSTPAMFEMYLQVAEEVASVGRAHGVPIPSGERERVRRFAAALPPDAYSSLYNDLVTGRPMEVDALQGTVIRLGERYGVPTPNARAIYAALLPHAVAARRDTPAATPPDP